MDTIRREMEQRLVRSAEDMNRICLEFLVDMLNLIFGKGNETDMFWSQYLVPEVFNRFKVEEAIKYSQQHDNYEFLINKKNINLNMMFYSFVHLFGLDIVPVREASKTEDQAP